MEAPTIEDRRILVTGGAGFIGSHLVDALAHDNEVRVLDDFSTGTRSHVPDEATIIDGNIRNRETVTEAASDVDIVFHQAACVDVTETVAHPERTNRTNLDGTLVVLECARDEGARVVVASSAAIYGRPDGLPIAETASTNPQSPYGVQKLALDHYTRLYAALYGVETVALRYFNVYGPRQRGPYSGVISTFLEQAAAGEPITVEGDGEQTRDFVHVSDVVRANLLAATTDTVGEAYNVATGERTSIRELAELVREVTGSESPIVHDSPRPGDVRHSAGDPTKAATELGFKSRVDLETGIRDLVSNVSLRATDRR